MRRTDVYLKLELVLEEKESAERVAAEICRQVRKLHGVRQAEVSNTVASKERGSDCAVTDRALVRSFFLDCSNRETNMKRLKLFSVLALGASLAHAAPLATERLAAAAQSFKEVMGTPDKSIPQGLMNKAQCIVIVPA